MRVLIDGLETFIFIVVWICGPNLPAFQIEWFGFVAIAIYAHLSKLFWYSPFVCYLVVNDETCRVISHCPDDTLKSRNKYVNHRSGDEANLRYAVLDKLEDKFDEIAMLLEFFSVVLLALSSSVSGQSSQDIYPQFPGEFRKYHLKHEPTYFVMASKMVRPGMVYRVTVSIFQTMFPITVRASIQRDGVELATALQEVKQNIPETLLLKVSIDIINNYKKCV
ncbi:CD109 antigen [Caerostris darwini]|uniref:CD109 antigen n=1 Tax=Caerostris darwini TaxID=1538125 RepID=A0AAV4UUH0_9ARAC|nr:CD109 antigen [Caerostris darwini]